MNEVERHFGRTLVEEFIFLLFVDKVGRFEHVVKAAAILEDHVN